MVVVTVHTGILEQDVIPNEIGSRGNPPGHIEGSKCPLMRLSLVTLATAWSLPLLEEVITILQR